MRFRFLVLSSCLLVSFAAAQWEPDIRLTGDDSGSHTSFNNTHCIAGSGRVVHVAWYDRRTGTDQIFYKRSTDAGTTWSQDTALTTGTGGKSDPGLAVMGDLVHLVWEDRRGGYNSEVYYRRSTDNGVSWESETRLTIDNYLSQNPCVCTQGDRVHVAWANDTAGREVYYLRSTDRGVTWGDRRRLTFDMQESYYPSLAAVGNVVHCVWRDWRDHSFEVYYLRSATYGQTWDSIPVRLSGDPASGSYNPCIAASGPGAHVIWWDTRDTPFELYYRRTTDYGNTWEPEVRLTFDTTGSYNPTIAAEGASVHVTWEALYGSADIYVRSSFDVGATWLPEQRLTNDQFLSVSPSVAVIDSGIHVIWTDFRDSDYGEIYYKRNLTGNVGVEEERSTPYALRTTPIPTIVRGVLETPETTSREPQAANALLDIAGRKVLDLHPGPNDVSRLAPGVYFVREEPETSGHKLRAIRKITITR